MRIKKISNMYIFVFFIFPLTFSSVIQLTDDSFEGALKGKKAFVMFFSPSCGHCQRLKPTYQSLSLKSSIKKSQVLIASVDCTEKGKSTCAKYGVNGFPTLKFFSHENGQESITDYDGNRDISDLERFVIDSSRPAIIEIEDEEISSFVQSSTLPVVLAFVKDQKSSFLTKLKALAPQHKTDYIFGYSFSAGKAKELGQKIESLAIFRQTQYKSPHEDHVSICTSEKEIPSFLTKHRFSLVEYRTRKNADKFLAPHISVFIKIDPLMKKSSAKRLRNIILKTAKLHTDITFSITKGEDFAEFMTDFAPKAEEHDLYLVGFDKADKKYVGKKVGSIKEHKEFETILTEFIRDFQAGVLEPFIKSQPADTPDDGHVKVVTAHTFDSIVTSSDKDVFIEFYAPWCGHCKKLSPIYQQLATALKDEQSLVIAKYDATSNDPQAKYGIQGFPTIFLARADKKSAPIQYDGKRDAQSMLEFLRKNTKHGIKFDGSIPELKEEL